MAEQYDTYASKYEHLNNEDGIGSQNHSDNTNQNANFQQDNVHNLNSDSSDPHEENTNNGQNEPRSTPEWLLATSTNTPLWMRTLYASLPISAVCVLHGEIHDMQPISMDGELMPDTTYMALHYIFRDAGFDCLLHFDPIKGLRIDCLHDKVTDKDIKKKLESLCNRNIIESLMNNSSERAASLRNESTNPETVYVGLDAVAEAVSLENEYAMAFVIDYTSQVWEENSPDPIIKQTMLTCLELANSHATYNNKPVRFFNSEGEGGLRHPVIWLVDNLEDLPIWLTNGDGIRTVPIPIPDVDTREQMAKLLLKQHEESPEFADACSRFANATDGLSLRGMFECTRLAASNGQSLLKIEDAIRTYRHGLSENPWQSPRLREKLMTGEDILKERVKGQDTAVSKVLDILKRSALGLTGAHSKNKSSQPRGALYFAGPTGVGKTEMAKAITELVFADDQALLRFDMSEFQDNHAKVRLIGAPPGYVGYGGGGELTNAVEKRPQSIILFDEMDKAGSEVYDLFLQILSDGRLTDGQGRTVSFSECLIIFTSNQGITANSDELSNLNTENPEEAKQYDNVLRDAVESHFREHLGRPELLGRIGDNIVVFHPIRGNVAQELVNKFIDNVLSNIRLNVGNVVTLSEDARKQLEEITMQKEFLDMGGRGITTCVEEYLTNPLSRYLFDKDPNQAITITGFSTDENGLPSIETE